MPFISAMNSFVYIRFSTIFQWCFSKQVILIACLDYYDTYTSLLYSILVIPLFLILARYVESILIDTTDCVLATMI